MQRSGPRTVLATGLAAIALIAVGLPSLAQAGPGSASPASVVYDLAIERPLGLVEVVAGLGITSVAYPVAVLAKDGDVVVDQCVKTPTRSTFMRALGRLEDDRRSDCSPVAFTIEMTQLSVGAALKPLSWIFGGSPFHRGQREEGIEI